MKKHFRPSGRVIVTDKAIAHNMTRQKLTNSQFQRLVAINREFTECDFSYSDFDSSYLRKCVFDSCDFTGCNFTKTILRGSKFIGCKFDYAKFVDTHVDPEILDTGCPGTENMQQIFARTLRVNFHQIGDTVAANRAIEIELEATRVHLYKSWNSKESYYRKKYTGFRRIGMFSEWLAFIFLNYFWGNGESLFKLTISLAVLIIIIALGDVYFLRDYYDLSSYKLALLQAPEVLLGITSPGNFSTLILVGIASLRYIMFAFFVSILIKRWSRR